MKIVSCFCLGALGLATANAQTLHLVLHSPPGEFVGGGVDSDVTYFAPMCSHFYIDVYSYGTTLPNYVGFDVSLPAGGSMSASFSSQELGSNLLPGTYLNAERSGFQSPGHPGLWVAFNGSGSNTLTGNFTVNQIGYHQNSGNWVLDSFDASFTQYSDGSPLALTGRITYSTVPEPTSLLAICAGLTLLGVRRRRKAV